MGRIRLAHFALFIFAGCTVGEVPQGETAPPPVAGLEPTEHLPLPEGHASSTRSGDMIITEIHRRDTDEVLAFAEWNVPSRTGTVTIPERAVTVPVQPAAGVVLDFAAANHMTHDVWVNEADADVGYDAPCEKVYVGECGCCNYMQCTYCDWRDLPDIGWVYMCKVVAEGDVRCDPDCRCAEDECGSCGCGGCSCSGNCCL